MTYREKSAWGSLIFALGLLSYYLTRVVQVPVGNEAAAETMIAIFVSVTIIGIAVETAGSLLLFWQEKRTGAVAGERDRQIEAKGYRNAYVFCFGAVYVILLFVLVGPTVSGAPFTVFHALFSALYLSHVVKCGTLVFYHRRGVK